MWKYLALIFIIQLILEINSSRLDRVLDRLHYVETRLNTESKFRLEDFASIIDRLDAIDKKLNDSLQTRANEKGHEEIENLEKDVAIMKKAFREEKFRTRREIPKIETALKVVKHDLENYCESMLNETETTKAYVELSDELMKREIIAQINELKMEHMTFRSTVNGTSVLVKENNTKAEHLEVLLTELSKNLTSLLSGNIILQVIERVKTCAGLLDAGETRNGVYKLVNKYQVFCDQTTDDGGWTVFQRRQNGEVDFYRNWTEYKNGFGDLNGEFWLGNELLSQLTADGKRELRIDMKDSEGNRVYAHYSNFKIFPEKEKFKLEVSGFKGTVADSLRYQNGRPFSTYDHDNDHTLGNCAERYRAAWWYDDDCFSVNLNAPYGLSKTDINGIRWNRWIGRGFDIMTFTELKFR